MDITSAPLPLPLLRLDGYLMHPPARPLRFDIVAKSLEQQDGEGGAGLQGVVAAVVGQRRQVVKAAFPGLVEAALPDVSPAQAAQSWLRSTSA
ncbi:hypothetical protein HaLaN_26916 [Haematococcus lacustris]|uniref:Uncharacterized protein n=1 Tax=Haematococcus lacustris TaxID=44745 RepID=A0A6A0A756_HAELA|nr:hypothetical protein HaLaN_26916 [Haematococcus lacustris]